MYPGTIIEYVDQSFIEPITIETVTNRPLLFALFTSDKGPESFQRVYGKDFFSLYGNDISFEKHGQPLLQAAMSINAGAELFCKRIVANDSRLGGRAIIAKIRTPNNDDITEATITHYSYYPGNVSPTDAETLSMSALNYCEELFRTKAKTEDVYKVNSATQLYTDKNCTTPVSAEVQDLCDEQGRLVVEKVIHYGDEDPVKDAWYFTESNVNYFVTEKYNYDDSYKIVNTGTQLYSDKECTTAISSAVTGLCDATGKLLIGKVVNYGTEGDVEDAWYFNVSNTNYFVTEENTSGEVQLIDIPNSQFVDISNEHWFPLLAVTENGRGVSTKSFDIIENSRLSKNLSFAVYDIEVHEGLEVIETIHFSMDPSAISGTTSMSLNEQARNAIQFDAYQDTEQYDKMMQLLMNATTRSKNEIVSEDFVFAKTRAGQTDLTWMSYKDGSEGNVEHIIATDVLSETNININEYTALAMVGGSNGSFGSRPINAATYASAMNAVFSIDSATNVEMYPEIYNLDEHKIMAIIDANYPDTVKASLSEFVAIREDCMFLRDMGTNGLNTATAITNAASLVTNKSKFTALYCQYYDIKDPYTYKQITVSIGYSLVRLLINQYNNGINLPLAGQKYGVTIPEAIYGTLNFAPLNLPSGNQKEAFDDARLNYASYFGDLLVLETEYTTYEKFSQFSYLNNILGIQEAIRAVRTRCPLIRYSFISGGDFDAYQADVNAVLANYTNNFVSLELEYLGDDTYVANKIFYAAIKVKFKDFVQTEWFKVIALGTGSEA